MHMHIGEAPVLLTWKVNLVLFTRPLYHSDEAHLGVEKAPNDVAAAAGTRQDSSE